MRTESKESVRNSVSRMLFVALSILIQIGWLSMLAIRLSTYSTWLGLLGSLLALLIVLYIYGSSRNAAFKMTWMIILLVFPPMGLCLYFLIGNAKTTKRMHQRFEAIGEQLTPFREQSDEALRMAEKENIYAANQMRYIRDFGNSPVYSDTEVEFYADAMQGFLAQLEALEQAEHFIFMEYHAIEQAQSFAMLHEVLKRKAAAGVTVRIFYDDVGSIGFINHDFVKRMKADGIDCRDFNPVMPVLNLFMNNRDHRKITVIDGKVGFTGGYNLADEYFNMTHPYGEWKDTGIKLTGAAVRSLTVMFLEMWNGTVQTDKDFAPFFPEVTGAADGYVQPFSDTPLDEEYVGENVYLNLIKSAKHKLYVTTPYLIISDEMTRELGLAAKRGVDVRIFTPGIPDKKVIFKMTRSYYGQLVQQGVRIYEFTPGFLHAKQMLCDDEAAVVGTINLDFRSLYHHFENGVFLYKCRAIADIAKDFDDLLPRCTEMTEIYRHRSKALRIGQIILRLFAPMM